MKISVKSLTIAALSLISGILVGAGILEITFRLNPKLLFRGMALPGPVDTPLTQQKYLVRYSDADVFIWRRDLIKPIPSERDKIEAQVVYTTDELGFRNDPPLPEKVDVVVLGRSVSLAAHLPKSWLALLSQASGLKVINLAQPGGELPLKKYFYRKYGKPHKPKWIILEIVPSIDILGNQKNYKSLFGEMVVPLVQGLIRQSGYYQDVTNYSNPIYPLSIHIGSRSVGLTCCLHYMEFYSLSKEDLSRTLDWQSFSKGLSELARETREQDSCLLLLLAPTKPDIYFPLATKIQELTPTLNGVIPYRLNQNGTIDPAPDLTISPEIVRRNANAGGQLIQEWAEQNNIPIVDPTDLMVQTIIAGMNPFMVYDSHWNTLGHNIVAQAVLDTLRRESCP